MTYQAAERAMRLGEKVAVTTPGKHKNFVRTGTIVSMRDRFKGGCVMKYVTIVWSKPSQNGQSAVEVRASRVMSVQDAFSRIC